jgi:5-methylcytosine-specific restriction enzyme subunit McrC
VTAVDINLTEWTSADPDQRPELRGRDLGNAAARRVAAMLDQSGRLTVLELASGLHIEATSFVGSVAVGPLRIAIQPKIPGDDLLTLLRYAFGLRKLDLHQPHEQRTAPRGFLDIILLQLAAEVAELLARGLHRRYLPRAESLANPRGRIDFGRLASLAGAEAALPCHYHPRTEDCIHNQLLLAGLQLGVRLTADSQVQGRLRRLAKLVEEGVSHIRLDWTTIDRARRESSRLTRTYAPAVTLIEILLQNAGVLLSGADDLVRAPGFLFDMNLFWQNLMSRFLRDNLAGYRVEDQFRLRGMLAYIPEHNPRRRQAPTPRPDFVVTKSGRITAILDAKYRDLWETSLPREMLYQLVIYALSHRYYTEATILYPTAAMSARESRIAVRESLEGAGRGTVVLRPVHLPQLAGLIEAARTPSVERQSAAYAEYLAFGRDQTPPS